jgi:hypothetical protein
MADLQSDGCIAGAVVVGSAVIDPGVHR